MDKAKFMEILATTTDMRPETKEKRGRGRLCWSVICIRGGALIGIGSLARSTHQYFTPLTAVADEIEPGQWGCAYEELFNDEGIDKAANALQMDPELATRIHEASRFAPENNESATDKIRQLRRELLRETKALNSEDIEDLRARMQQ